MIQHVHTEAVGNRTSHIIMASLSLKLFRVALCLLIQIKLLRNSGTCSKTSRCAVSAHDKKTHSLFNLNSIGRIPDLSLRGYILHYWQYKPNNQRDSKRQKRSPRDPSWGRVTFCRTNAGGILIIPTKRVPSVSSQLNNGSGPFGRQHTGNHI